MAISDGSVGGVVDGYVFSEHMRCHSNSVFPEYPIGERGTPWSEDLWNVSHQVCDGMGDECLGFMWYVGQDSDICNEWCGRPQFCVLGTPLVTPNYDGSWQTVMKLPVAEMLFQAAAKENEEMSTRKEATTILPSELASLELTTTTDNGGLPKRCGTTVFCRSLDSTTRWQLPRTETKSEVLIGDQPIWCELIQTSLESVFGFCYDVHDLDSFMEMLSIDEVGGVIKSCVENFDKVPRPIHPNWHTEEGWRCARSLKNLVSLVNTGPPESSVTTCSEVGGLHFAGIQSIGLWAAHVCDVELGAVLVSEGFLARMRAEAMVSFDRALRRVGLRWFLGKGSLLRWIRDDTAPLGALQHGLGDAAGGGLPWDDDIDAGFFLEDLEAMGGRARLLEELRREGFVHDDNIDCIDRSSKRGGNIDSDVLSKCDLWGHSDEITGEYHLDFLVLHYESFTNIVTIDLTAYILKLVEVPGLFASEASNVISDENVVARNDRERVGLVENMAEHRCYHEFWPGYCDRMRHGRCTFCVPAFELSTARPLPLPRALGNSSSTSLPLLQPRAVGSYLAYLYGPNWGMPQNWAGATRVAAPDSSSSASSSERLSKNATWLDTSASGMSIPEPTIASSGPAGVLEVFEENAQSVFPASASKKGPLGVGWTAMLRRQRVTWLESERRCLHKLYGPALRFDPADERSRAELEAACSEYSGG